MRAGYFFTPALSRHSVPMTTLSDAMVVVSDSILGKISGLSLAEIVKRGRKYRFVKSSFHRVKDEDKHLVINPSLLADHVSTVLAYSIIKAIDANLFSEYRDLCLAIIGVARQLEENDWYENENSSVVALNDSNAITNPDLIEEARLLVQEVTPAHVVQGCNILYCSKLNFLHTDHHIGTTFEGIYLRKYVEEYYGSEALELPEVLAAIKSFVHWGNIRYLLYKLGVPHMKLDDSLVHKFSTFPDPPQELKDCVYERFPSGTSKYSMLSNVIDMIADSKYSKVIPYPPDDNFDVAWLYDLCDDIERDPIRYHLRSIVKDLSKDPVNLNELSQVNHDKIDTMLRYVSLILNTILSAESGGLAQNSRLPVFSDALISAHEDYFKKLVDLQNSIEEYEQKGWDEDDIVLRLSNGRAPNFYDEVDRIRR